jgi:6-phosphogluconolactonase/glucosamine-6-phosphate isomerase/deaminase
MKIHVSSNPAKEAGEYLSKLISTHDGDIVCLLSGGSALAIVPYIVIDNYSFDKDNESCVIFMVGDERWSRDEQINNSLQCKTRYPDHPVSSSLIPTVPEKDESLPVFASRVEKAFLEKISQCKNPKIISLLGMGVDGHTAGIFPLPEETFTEVYRDDQTYVPVHVVGLKIDSRASFTPKWLLDHVDVIIGYVVGTDKKTILESLLQETKPIHERPAELFKIHPDVHLYTDLSF